MYELMQWGIGRSQGQLECPFPLEPSLHATAYVRRKGWVNVQSLCRRVRARNTALIEAVVSAGLTRLYAERGDGYYLPDHGSIS